MKKLLSLIILANTLLASAGNQPDTWFSAWLMPSSGLFIWSVITFLIVFIILRWKAWGPLMNTLDAREKQINDALSAAEAAKEEAAKVASNNEEVLNEARKEAQAIVAQARDAGEKLKVKLETDGHAKYDDLLTKAKDQIESEKQKALGEIKQMVVDVAITASEKVIKRNLNTDDNKKMIEKTVDEFKQAN